jgi:hypothetical protein
MTRAYFKVVALLLCAVAFALPARTRAAFMADPDKLYAEMKAAFEKGNAQGWTFYNQEYYLSTIFDAGRAYSLQRPTDPQYPVIEQATVDVATGVHYDPLINHDAVPWYVREAAVYIERNSSDAAEVAKAKDLLARVDALEDPAALARYADQDAQAAIAQYRGDSNAKLLGVEANWRGWLITHDPSWRSLALQRASDPNFPLANLPSTWGPGFLNAVLNASHGAEGYTQADIDNAKAIQARADALPQLKTIASVEAQTHARMMTTLAPADEYFGPMGMSILGMRNELYRVNYLINLGYARQESGAAVQVANSVDGMHRVYPRDRDLPQMLLDVYKTLAKIDTEEAKVSRTHIRAILTVEYQDTKQAQELLNS